MNEDTLQTDLVNKAVALNKKKLEEWKVEKIARVLKEKEVVERQYKSEIKKLDQYLSEIANAEAVYDDSCCKRDREHNF